MTQNYHNMPLAFPPQPAQLSPPSIDDILNPSNSRAVAQNLLTGCEWLVNRLGIHQGQISVYLHQNQPTKVKYVVCDSYGAAQRRGFDDCGARSQYEELTRILSQSNCCLHPRQACACIQAFFSLLLLRSNEEFGDVIVNVSDSRAQSVQPAPIIRLDDSDASERTYQFLYRR